MPLTEDFNIFFDADEHGTAAKYTPPGYTHPSSRTRDIVVIFDREYVETSNIEGYAPVVTIEAAKVTDIAHDAKLTIDSAVYKVVEVRPDGTGVVSAVLQLSA